MLNFFFLSSAKTAFQVGSITLLNVRVMFLCLLEMGTEPDPESGYIFRIRI